MYLRDAHCWLCCVCPTDDHLFANQHHCFLYMTAPISFQYVDLYLAGSQRAAGAMHLPLVSLEIAKVILLVFPQSGLADTFGVLHCDEKLYRGTTYVPIEVHKEPNSSPESGTTCTPSTNSYSAEHFRFAITKQK